MGNRILPTAGLPSTQSSLFLCFRLQEFQDHPVRNAWLYGNKKHVVSVPRFILLEICELFYGAANDSLSFLGGPARIRTGDRQVSLAVAMSLPLFQSVGCETWLSYGPSNRCPMI